MNENKNNENVVQTTTNNDTNISTNTCTMPVLVREFELAVYDVNLNDNDVEEYRPVNTQRPITITASSPQELKSKLQIFESCNQKAKIVREITPKALIDDFNKKMQQYKNNTNNVELSSSIENTNLNLDINKDLAKALDKQQTKNVDYGTNRSNNINMLQQLQQNCSKISQQTRARYFKIGNVSCKEVNGKIYQRLWISATDAEANNIRIINNKTNAIVKLDNKHIEIQKWILIEENYNNDDNDLIIDED